MTKNNWNNFVRAREQFRSAVNELSQSLPMLRDIQQQFINSRSEGKTAAYTVETPVLYNTALDEIMIDDDIKLILVADNPGRREQAAENRRYLVGPSGKIAHKFFRDNPALGIDYQKNVIILNKTPIHSPRTAELRKLCLIEAETGKRAISSALEESQKTMAALLLRFHEALDCPVWITGYSEMRKGGIFESYTETLKALYANNKERFDQIFIYRHFSMNQFTIDLKQQARQNETTAKCLKRIGSAYRQRILQ